MKKGSLKSLAEQKWCEWLEYKLSWMTVSSIDPIDKHKVSHLENSSDNYHNPWEFCKQETTLGVMVLDSSAQNRKIISVKPYDSQELDVIIFLFFLGLALLRFGQEKNVFFF